MRETAARVGKVLGLVAVGAYPLFIHEVLATGQWTIVAAVLSALQVAVLGAIMLARSVHRHKWWLAAAVVSLFLVLSWHSARESLLATSGIPHAVAYIGLLIVFGASLLSGREALITTLARKIYGPLPADVAAYTRAVTWAWCFFFTGQLFGSLLLFLYAPVTVWSLFVNVLNVPLIVLMFTCEYIYRLARVPNHGRAKISVVIRAFAHRETAAPKAVDPG